MKEGGSVSHVQKQGWNEYPSTSGWGHTHSCYNGGCPEIKTRQWLSTYRCHPDTAYSRSCLFLFPGFLLRTFGELQVGTYPLVSLDHCLFWCLLVRTLTSCSSPSWSHLCKAKTSVFRGWPWVFCGQIRTMSPTQTPLGSNCTSVGYTMCLLFSQLVLH